jgi:aminocarboxymuconate-semialdehyde decarboxylase
MSSPTITIDVHTHMYPPPYLNVLKQRDTVPFIRSYSENANELRLIILPEEAQSTSTARGRPIGPEYWDTSAKIQFMNDHGIQGSVISLANPWLDFMDPVEAVKLADELNEWFEVQCLAHKGRLWYFAALPLKQCSAAELAAQIHRLKDRKYARGIVMGTGGLGKGLDDADLDPVWHALASTQQMIFLHPHYGLPGELYGPRNAEYGHVLPLALGFPLETTIAITRMILSGAFERHPTLKILLAHSGGTLPFLAGRIQSCIEHDAHFNKGDGAKIEVWKALHNNIFLDAVIYSEVGLKSATEAVSAKRVMFGEFFDAYLRPANRCRGTDHPFFPPLSAGEKKWASVETNKLAVAAGLQEHDVLGVMGQNAVNILNLDVDQNALLA